MSETGPNRSTQDADRVGPSLESDQSVLGHWLSRVTLLEVATLVIAIVALVFSVWASQAARDDNEENRRVEDHRRLREVLGEMPAVQLAVAEGDVTAIQTAQLRVREAATLAEKLGSRVLPAERMGLALGFILVNDFQAADVLLETAQADAASVIDEVQVLRLRAQVWFGLEDPLRAREFIAQALERTTPESLGSQFLEDDVDVITSLQGFHFERLLGSCSIASEHLSSVVEIKNRLGPLVELTTLFPDTAILDGLLEECNNPNPAPVIASVFGMTDQEQIELIDYCGTLTETRERCPGFVEEIADQGCAALEGRRFLAVALSLLDTALASESGESEEVPKFPEYRDYCAAAAAS